MLDLSGVGGFYPSGFFNHQVLIDPLWFILKYSADPLRFSLKYSADHFWFSLKYNADPLWFSLPYSADQPLVQFKI